jgi:hypothetical protein
MQAHTYLPGTQEAFALCEPFKEVLAQELRPSF